MLIPNYHLQHIMSVAYHTFPTTPVLPAATITTPRATPSLPTYALDGRPLEWNAERTAVRFDSTNAEYHSDLDAVSSSMLKAISRSPAHLRAKMFAKHDDDTTARRLGTGVHTFCLEPTRFDREYTMYSGRRQGLAWEAFEANNQTKTILTASEHDRVVGCGEATLCAPAVQGDGGIYTVEDLITHGTVERNTYWVDEATGLTCRMRTDLEIQNVTVDLKTTDDARAEAFAWQCERMGYDIQAAFYTRGRRAFDPDIESFPFIFVAAELAPHYGVQAHVADYDEFVRPGDVKVGRLLAQFQRCREANQWPSYPAPSTTLKLPFSKRYPVQLDI